MLNISMHIQKTYFVFDDDAQKQQPCFYALKQMGWQVIPHVLEFVEDKRSATEIELLGDLLQDICGSKVAVVILEERTNKLTGDPSKAQAIANINQIVSHISGVGKAVE